MHCQSKFCSKAIFNTTIRLARPALLVTERQFYVTWPLLVITAVVLFRCGTGQTVVALLAIAGFCSIVASVVIVFHNQPLAFYHPETRACS